MIHKGIDFESDIKSLKELKTKSVKNPSKHEASYIQMRDKLAKKYKVTIRTMQNYVKEKSAWVRKKRADAGKERVKLSGKEKTMLHDAVNSGKNKKQALELVSSNSKNKISKYKAKQILKSEAESEKANQKDPAFSNEFKEFLIEHFNLDLIPPSKGIKLKVKKFNFIVTKQDANDIIMILSNAYNRFQYAQENKLKLDRNFLRRVRTWHLFEQLLELATQRLDQKIFNSITLAMQRLEIDPAAFANPNFKTLQSICKELKADITFDEIYFLLEKFTPQE